MSAVTLYHLILMITLRQLIKPHLIHSMVNDINIVHLCITYVGNSYYTSHVRCNTITSGIITSYIHVCIWIHMQLSMLQCNCHHVHKALAAELKKQFQLMTMRKTFLKLLLTVLDKFQKLLQSLQRSYKGQLLMQLYSLFALLQLNMKLQLV